MSYSDFTEYIQIDRKGQVPALKVGDEIFTESLRIVEFIGV